MPKLTVDRATAADAVAVESLLDAAAEWQQSRGFPMWTPGRFEVEVRQTIADGSLYVGRREAVIVGCFMLDDGSPRMTQWLVEHGRVPGSGTSVGRLAVAREAAGHGLGMKLLDEARTVAARQGFAWLRLDCPAENERLRRYYLEAGFSYCGDNDLSGPNGELWVSSVFELPTSA
jgi:ribosomal protein S18 acetylase RimI-like enzyme